MSDINRLYIGCPVQHVRQFIAGKWQMGILWNLRNETLCFSELRSLLPGISDKMLMQELDFFVDKKIIQRKALEFPSPKTEYELSSVGQSLIPIINAMVEWGYSHLQDEQVSKEMNMTPIPAIQAIENGMAERE
jgi:DNA-binding HxlR family transcriptional regulator